MKYRCSICGYIYDETAEGVPFAELPDTWQCPWCKAPKSAFEPVEEAPPAATVVTVPEEAPEMLEEVPDASMQKLSIGQMAALCSNLARGCEKQYMYQEMNLFNELSEWLTNHSPKVDDAMVETVTAQLQQDLTDYPHLAQTCSGQADRGALRACTWGEKATRMLHLLMNRYQKEGDALLVDNEIWVCSVCGFVYIGVTAPDLCPVCKVPSWKFNKIERRKKS